MVKHAVTHTGWREGGRMHARNRELTSFDPILNQGCRLLHRCLVTVPGPTAAAASSIGADACRGCHWSCGWVCVEGVKVSKGRVEW
jgi:hypothetical protein